MHYRHEAFLEMVSRNPVHALGQVSDELKHRRGNL